MTMIVRLIVVLSLCAFFWACAPKSDNDLSLSGWELTEDAASTYYYLLLEDAKRSNNSTVGEFALEQLLRQDVSPLVYIEAGNFYWHLGETGKAIVALQKGRKKYPKNKELGIMLAQIYLAEKDLDSAAETIESYLAQQPDDIETRQGLADILVRNEQYEKALEVLQKIPKSSYTPTIGYFLAKIRGGMGQRQKAIAELKQVLKQDPELMEAWAELAYLYEMEKDYTAAEKTYMRILDLGESSQELWLRLIDLNLKLNNPDKALEMTRRGPNEKSFFLGAGTLFVDQGFYEHAERILAPLIKQDANAQEVYYYLGLLAYRGEKDIDKAVRLLRKVPNDNGYYDRALRFIAHLLYEKGDVDAALKTAEQGREIFAGNKEFWTLEASLYEDLEKYDRAVTILDNALELWPQDSEIEFLLGIVEDKRGNKPRAMKLMEDIVAREPNHADALNYIGYTLADTDRDLDRALAMINKAMALKPDNGYIQDSLAWVYFKQGELQKAWVEIKGAVTKAKSDSIIWEHYGDIALALGNKAEARKGYEKALQLKTKDKEKVRKKLESL